MKTDTQLQLDVIAELGWEPSISVAQIGVEVRHGIVTLAGHVDSYSERWHAELAAQRVSGVKGLIVELDVRLPGLNKRTDADIARAAQDMLKSWAYLPTDSVKIKVDKGWITLSGEVESDYQRRAASDAVRHLIGVTGVSEQITIKPKGISVLVAQDALIERPCEQGLSSASKCLATSDHHAAAASNCQFFGITTASMACTTPLVAAMSICLTWAPLI
jgi:osmotically-inducible protein OsmY